MTVALRFKTRPSGPNDASTELLTVADSGSPAQSWMATLTAPSAPDSATVALPARRRVASGEYFEVRQQDRLRREGRQLIGEPVDVLLVGLAVAAAGRRPGHDGGGDERQRGEDVGAAGQPGAGGSGGEREDRDARR